MRCCFVLLCAGSTAALLVVIFIPERRQIRTPKVLQWDSPGSRPQQLFGPLHQE